ncbi:MAG: glutamate racemase [Ferruginibacter sp.]
MKPAPIGIFDSGYGGLTVLKEIKSVLPQYDYLYLGDNARAPYGTRSFERVYKYSLEAVQWFFNQGCNLVILACNTASAKALRTIQQNDLPKMGPGKRVLGVIRPTAELIGTISQNGHVGVLATNGTVQSRSYIIEIQHFSPDIKISQEACTMWVPLIENNEYNSEGAGYFVKKNIDNLMAKDADIDTILLACTHYPLLLEQIKKYVAEGINIIPQGEIVAKSLEDYLQRHPEIELNCSKNGLCHYYTTDDTTDFDSHAVNFLGETIKSVQVRL